MARCKTNGITVGNRRPQLAHCACCCKDLSQSIHGEGMTLGVSGGIHPALASCGKKASVSCDRPVLMNRVQENLLFVVYLDGVLLVL